MGTIAYVWNFRELFDNDVILDTIMDSDMILVMSEGKVAEYDTPKSLLDDPVRHSALSYSHL